ncbi:Two pore domain potassium channel [Macleaya cordata]|uniref:Two pore domain potassium channel n=1 Tax=Macleaya cordata TaxID=56857 RepID=A0A200QM90_MACCD|nr:Two pore domain potassium channel [Macleaya cordata]
MEEKEPLLQAYPRSPRRKPPTPLPAVGGGHLSTPPLSLLCPLPEDGEITLPSLTNHHRHPSSPLTPSELKDLLIFGPPPSSPSTTTTSTTTITIDALTLADDPSSSSHRLEQEEDDDETPTTTTTSASSSSWLLDPTTNVALPWTKTKSITNKTNLHRSKTAPAMAAINNLDHHLHHTKPPKFASPSIVRQAVLLLLLYLSLGVVIYSFNRKNFSAKETHPIVDALYFCIVTMCTIGYGDITPTTTSTKLFSIMFVLVGFGFIDILLSGMVSYVLDLQENLLLTTVKGGGGVGAGGAAKHDSARSYFIDVKKGRMRIRIKVGLALGVVILCIGIGTGVMHFVERLGWLDSFYLSVMSVTTVGYGDRAFNSLPGRIFASIWLLVSTLAVARAFLYLAEARIDKRHRMMSKWVLGQDMTVSEFLAADIDNNGFVRFVFLFVVTTLKNASLRSIGFDF